MSFATFSRRARLHLCNIFLSRECASLAKRFLFHRKCGAISYETKNGQLHRKRSYPLLLHEMLLRLYRRMPGFNEPFIHRIPSIDLICRFKLLADIFGSYSFIFSSLREYQPRILPFSDKYPEKDHSPWHRASLLRRICHSQVYPYRHMKYSFL